MNFRPQIKVLAPEDLDRVHTATLKILNETGVAFGSVQALTHFKEHDFKTDGETVFFAGKQVEHAHQYGQSAVGPGTLRLPTRTLTGHTDAKIPDYQAGYETMQSFLLAALRDYMRQKGA